MLWHGVSTVARVVAQGGVMVINSNGLLMDEMSIVDIFTRLIFDAESPLGVCEQMVVSILVDLVPSLEHASRRDLSEYLRAMSVDEMIQAVNQVKHEMNSHPELIASNTGHAEHRVHS